jgi:hypothetical protein
MSTSDISTEFLLDALSLAPPTPPVLDVLYCKLQVALWDYRWQSNNLYHLVNFLINKIEFFSKKTIIQLFVHFFSFLIKFKLLIHVVIKAVSIDILEKYLMRDGYCACLLCCTSNSFMSLGFWALKGQCHE